MSMTIYLTFNTTCHGDFLNVLMREIKPMIGALVPLTPYQGLIDLPICVSSILICLNTPRKIMPQELPMSIRFLLTFEATYVGNDDDDIVMWYFDPFKVSGREGYFLPLKNFE